MALSLFCINKCQFDNCGLYFASLYDLIQHIEETHLPVIENKHRKLEEERAAMAMSSTLTTEGATKPSTTLHVGPALPLSAIYRLFPVLPPHKAQPIKYEPTKISFYHYRKKQVPLPAVSTVHYSQVGFADKSRTTSRSEHDEEVSNDSFRTTEEDGDAYEPTDEKKHKCPVEGCNKRYKNLQGARYHVRTVHGLNEDSPLSLPLDTVVINSDGQSVAQQTQNSLNRPTT
uniref:C2H2-type domain-containing protein n=1 Tax=Syphacia muris TaxID=451379 RepID=A0A0N5ABH8_9BILA